MSSQLASSIAMAVMGIKANKCVFITLFLLTLATETRGHETQGHKNHGHETHGHETHGHHTCKEFSLPEDAAKAKAFVNELTDQSRPGKPITVSTSWCTAAAGDSETAEEQLQTGLDRKMEEMETGLKKKMEEMETGLKGKMEEMETREKGMMEEMEKKLHSRFDMTMEAITDLQKRLDELISSLRVITVPAPQRCFEAGMIFTAWGCFKGFPISKTWNDSKAHCASEGLELASLEKGPTTKEDLIQLTKDIGLIEHREYFIDLTRQPSGKWRWGSYGAIIDNVGPLWVGGKSEDVLEDNKGLLAGGSGLRDIVEDEDYYFLCALP